MNARWMIPGVVLLTGFAWAVLWITVTPPDDAPRPSARAGCADPEAASLAEPPADHQLVPLLTAADDDAPRNSVAEPDAPSADESAASDSNSPTVIVGRMVDADGNGAAAVRVRFGYAEWQATPIDSFRRTWLDTTTGDDGVFRYEIARRLGVMNGTHRIGAAGVTPTDTVIEVGTLNQLGDLPVGLGRVSGRIVDELGKPIGLHGDSTLNVRDGSGEWHGEAIVRSGSQFDTGWIVPGVCRLSVVAESTFWIVIEDMPVAAGVHSRHDLIATDLTTVRVTVLNALDDTLVPGAVISWRNAGPTYERRASTGEYVIGPMLVESSRRLRVSASAAGFQSATWCEEPPTPEREKHVVLRLTPMGSIVCELTDGPLSNPGHARLVVIDDGNGESPGELLREAPDVHGQHLTWLNVPAGRYRLLIDGPGGVVALDASVVAGAQTDLGKLARASTGPPLVVRVTDERGQPMPDLGVDATRSVLGRVHQSTTVFTDSDGRATFDGFGGAGDVSVAVSRGEYRLGAYRSLRLPRGPGGRLVELVLADARSHVSGVLLTDTEKPWSGAALTARIPGRWRSRAETGTDGRFDFGNAPVGEGTVTFVWRQQTIEIPFRTVDGEPCVIAFILPPLAELLPYRVRGVVLDDSGVPIPCARASTFASRLACDADGHFEYQSATPPDPESEWAMESSGYRHRTATMSATEVSPGEYEATVRVVSVSRMAHIFAEIRGADGMPLPADSVWLQRIDDVRYRTSRPQPPGTHAVRVEAPGYAHVEYQVTLSGADADVAFDVPREAEVWVQVRVDAATLPDVPYLCRVFVRPADAHAPDGLAPRAIESQDIIATGVKRRIGGLLPGARYRLMVVGALNQYRTIATQEFVAGSGELQEIVAAESAFDR